MPSKRSGCRGPKLRSFFKVDHQTSRRRALGESEIPEAVAMLLRLAGFPGNVCPVSLSPDRAPRALLCWILGLLAIENHLQLVRNML